MKKFTKALVLLAVVTSILITGCTPMASSQSGANTQAEAKVTAAEVLPASTEPAAAPAKANSPWQVVFEKKVKQPVRMAAFLNETFGVTGGATGAGKTHHTTDGGATWTKAEDSGGCIFGVDIVDDQRVWVCGRMSGASFTTPGGVRMSADGGTTWGPKTSYRPKPILCLLSFLDAQIGWVANDGKLSATADGGTTWVEIAPPKDITKIAAISLVTASLGYVLDQAGNLYTTLDGGKSWSSQTLGLERFGKFKLMPSSELAAVTMRFQDANHGVIILNLMDEGKSKVVALRTADGGQTWQEEAIPAKIGTPYLSRDGKFLTLYGLLDSDVTVLRYGQK